MKNMRLKEFVLLISFFAVLTGFGQGKYIKFGATVPGTNLGALVGKGACLSLGKESPKIFNVRARVALDLFYHKNASASLIGYDHNYGSFGGDFIESKTYTSTMFLNGQLVASWDYFLFKNCPNFYFGPDAFLSMGINVYDQTSIYTSGGGVKAHVGFEKPLGNKLKVFGEYSISYVVTTPYFEIPTPSFSSQAERPNFLYTVFHQCGLGFRF
jgi:hypothetical protein